MESKNQVGFVLSKITTEQFAIIESSFDQSNDIVEVTNSVRFGAQIEDKVIGAIVLVQFSQEKGPIIILEIACFFEIMEDNWNELYDEALEQVKIPRSLASHFVVLAIGTLRGVLHAKVENTPLHGILMPTVNVTEIVKEDVIIDAKNS
jgi:hypothetical protein